MKFSIEESAKQDVKLAINWLAKVTSQEDAEDKIKEIIFDVKNQLLSHPHSGKKCQYAPLEKYREIIKGSYRTIYKVEGDNDKLHVIILVFCHVKMNYKTLISQSNKYIQRDL